ncbi:MAG: cell division ATP-binding protein FtsE [Armatimonadetes bacterium]|nr:cell division ATP-binding protein FtsE [Armatimonadota bacterium]
MIEFRSVSVVYPNGVKALVDVSTEIEKGEFVFLVGPTGSGKSTFLRLIYGEARASVGDVIVEGKSVRKLRHHQIPFLRRRMGIIFQDFKLLPNKTIYENAAYALEVIGAPSREIARKVSHVLYVVGLEHKVRMFPHELSGGEQQRTSIARALINHPPILLADEPTGNLDPDTAWDIMQLLQQINQKGTTVLMATHNRIVVDSMKKRVLTLGSGAIVGDQLKGGYSGGS